MFDPATYSVTEGDSNVTLNISFVTSEPLTADSTIRISSIPTVGTTDEATREYLNVVYYVISIITLL